MWVNRALFDMIVKDNKSEQLRNADLKLFNRDIVSRYEMVISQKSRDDMTIDWMRHRVNALEKQNAILMQKATGLAFPIPEIVPNRPGSMSPDAAFDSMPSFEDVGDEEATRLGIIVDEMGELAYKK